MLVGTVRTRGSYRIANRQGAFEESLHPAMRGELRVQRILESLRSEIADGGAESLRIRRILAGPNELYRLEMELPELGYQRTTLLDRDTLDELLAADDLKDVQVL